MHILKWTAAIAFFVYSLVSDATSCKIPLSLSEAEYLAIFTAPELKQLRANANSLDQQSVAEGQLPDPQLMAGLANVPTDTFSFTQDDMTMVQFGLRQSFAPGHSLTIKSKKTRALAKAEQQKIQEQSAILLRNLREIWLDLYYWQQAAVIIRESRSLYQRLLKVTASQYSNGKSSQSDVLQLQLELSRLNDQAVQIEQRIDILRAQLGRWIGTGAANRPLSNSLPHWLDPQSADILKTRLMQHPLLKVDAANIEAARNELAYAKEQYKPGWMIDVNYAVRQGNMPDEQPRSHFVGAQVTVDLPFFTGNRQDRRLSASTYQLTSTELARDVHYKDLLQEFNVQYAMWRNLVKRERLYRQQLTLEAKQSAKSALLAYQNASTDLSTVLRAYSNQLMIRLEQTQIQVERAKARAALLYLEEVTP